VAAMMTMMGDRGGVVWHRSVSGGVRARGSATAEQH
jgi:hypothetical protein